jgi:hypothetical protein
MPRATLSFKLPEDDSDFLLAKNGGKYFSALWEISQIMRKHWKYGAKMKDCWKEIEEELKNANLDEVA